MLRTSAPLIGALGFIMSVGNFRYIESYVHGNRIAVLIDLAHREASTAKAPDFIALARDLAMQIVALSPKAINPLQPPPEVRNREMAYLVPTLERMGAVERLDRIERANRDIDADFCLTEQPFFKDPDRKVRDVMADTELRLNDNIEIVRFVRWDIDET